MRRYSMPDKEAAAKILPKNPKDRKSLWVIGACLALMVIFVVTVLFLGDRRRHEMENIWQSATATIEDVRPVIASQVDSKVGSAMLYQAEVLADYRSNGLEQRRWIKIERLPELRADVEFKAFRWKGRQCIVRWKTSQPDQVIAELN